MKRCAESVRKESEPACSSLMFPHVSEAPIWLLGTSVRTIGDLVFHSHQFSWSYRTQPWKEEVNFLKFWCCIPDTSLCFHSELLKNPFPQQRAISTWSEMFLQNHAFSSRPQTTRKLKSGMTGFSLTLNPLQNYGLTNLQNHRLNDSHLFL